MHLFWFTYALKLYPNFNFVKNSFFVPTLFFTFFHYFELSYTYSWIQKDIQGPNMGVCALKKQLFSRKSYFPITSLVSWYLWHIRKRITIGSISCFMNFCTSNRFDYIPLCRFHPSPPSLTYFFVKKSQYSPKNNIL